MPIFSLNQYRAPMIGTCTVPREMPVGAPIAIGCAVTPN
jgi:hypothetical protein